MEKKQQKDLGVVRHESFERSEFVSIIKEIDDAKCKREIENERHKEEISKNKRHAREQIIKLEEEIKSIKQRLVETEAEEDEKHLVNKKDIELDIDRANKYLDKAVLSDFDSAKQKANKVAKELGYTKVIFHGKTDSHWQFSLSDLLKK